MKKFSRLVLFIMLSAAISSAALAQTKTGNIKGAVNDDQGNPLPGATVVINSPAMMARDVSFITGPKGGYRFPALPPGTYELKAKMPGFNTIIRPGIDVSLHQTVTINITLKPSPLAEEITVTAPSPAVDIKSTNVGQSFKAEYFDQIPNARDLWSAMMETPALVMNYYNVGSSETGVQGYFSAAGSARFQNTFHIDGFNTTSTTSIGASVSYYPYDSFEEIQVSTSSHSADVAAPGVALDIISKSGSNRFHGGAGFYYSNKNWQSDNLSAEAKEQGLTEGNPMEGYMDYSINLGGYIFKDKIWFWGLKSLQSIDSLIIGFEDEQGNPRVVPIDLTNIYAKLDFQLSKNNKISGLFMHDVKNNIYREAGAERPVETTMKQISWKNFLQVHWTSILSANAFIDLRLGSMWAMSPRPPSDYAEDAWCIRETRTVPDDALYSRGYHRSYYSYRKYDTNRRLINGFLNLYLDDFLGGSHEIKVGFQINKAWVNTERYSFGPRLDLRRGAGYRIRIENHPLFLKNNVWDNAFYLQDSIVLFNRLTLNLGIRYQIYESYLPEQGSPESIYPMNYFGELWNQTNPGVWDLFKERTFPAVRNIFDWKTLSPRIGMTYDVFGNGKTAIKASYSRYYHQIGTDWSDFINTNSRAYAYFRWDDDNGDLIWQEGEERNAPYSWTLPSTRAVNPDVKNPYTDEVTLGFETEILKDFSVGATFILRKEGDLTDDIDQSMPYSDWTKRTFTDLGPDGILGTPDDGTFEAYEPNYQPGREMYLTNPGDDPLYEWPVKMPKYQGLILRAYKKFSDKWQFLASFSFSKTEGYQGVGSEFITGIFNNPNSDIYSYGRNYWDRPVNIKMSGSYQFPWGINVGASIKHSSGQPGSRTHDTPELDYIDEVVVRVEELGSSRMDAVTIADLRVEKSFNLPSSGSFRGKLSFYLDVFNLLNANPTTNIGWNTADNLDRIYAILAPRILRLGVKFTF